MSDGVCRDFLRELTLSICELDLVKNQFMGGECYGMSYDLVQYIGSTQLLRGMITGKEDKLTTKWMKMHPKRDEIVWVSERCGIYDHPRAGTV